MSDCRSRRAAARLEAAAPREPERNLSESPLAWLARRKDKDGVRCCRMPNSMREKS